jgi:hypothetical protein
MQIDVSSGKYLYPLTGFKKISSPTQICDVSEVVIMHNSLATSGYKQNMKIKFLRKFPIFFG